MSGRRSVCIVVCIICFWASSVAAQTSPVVLGTTPNPLFSGMGLAYTNGGPDQTAEWINSWFLSNPHGPVMHADGVHFFQHANQNTSDTATINVGASESGNIATFTMMGSLPVWLVQGVQVGISGVGSGYNVNWAVVTSAVSGISTSTFTVALPQSGLAPFSSLPASAKVVLMSCSATISSGSASSGVATVTLSAAAPSCFPPSTLSGGTPPWSIYATVSGVVPAAYNGFVKLLSVSGTTITYNIPNGTTPGNISNTSGTIGQVGGYTTEDAMMTLQPSGLNPQNDAGVINTEDCGETFVTDIPQLAPSASVRWSLAQCGVPFLETAPQILSSGDSLTGPPGSRGQSGSQVAGAALQATTGSPSGFPAPLADAAAPGTGTPTGTCSYSNTWVRIVLVDQWGRPTAGSSEEKLTPGGGQCAAINLLLASSTQTTESRVAQSFAVQKLCGLSCG